MVQTSRWPVSRLPISNIQPFTYRDGETYLSLLNRLAEYITTQIHPNLRETVEEMMDELEHVLADQHQLYVTGIQDFQRIHDAFMTDVNSSLMALNDGAVSDLVQDPGSQLGVVLRELIGNMHEHVSVNVQRFGAVGDGSHDDTQSIQDAIDYVSEHYGGGTVIIPSGRYMIVADGDESQGSIHVHSDGGLQLADNVTLELHGNATLEAFPTSQNTYNVIRANMVKNVTIRGGELVGDREHHIGDGGEWGHGISVIGSDNVTIENTCIRNMWGDGIYVGLGGQRYHGRDITIRNIVIDNNRRQGISVVAGHNVTIENNTISNTTGTDPQAGIDIEPNSGNTCSNITIHNNTFDNSNYGVILYGPVGLVQDVKITSNTIINSRIHGVAVEDSQDVLVSGNHIDDSERFSVRVDDSQNCHVQGNICQSGQFGIGLYDSTRCEVTHNTVHGVGSDSSHSSVYLSGSTHCDVSSNTISESFATGLGIVGASEDNSIRGNTIDRSGAHGIQVYSSNLQSQRHVIAQNIITNSSRKNIVVSGGQDIMVSHNMLSGGASREYGGSGSRHMRVQGSSGVVVMGNVFRGGQLRPVVALRIEADTSDTLVSSNDFFNSADEAIRDDGQNTVLQDNNRVVAG